MIKPILIATTLIVLTSGYVSAETGSKPDMTLNNALLLAKRLEGRVAEEPKKCVSTSRLGQPVVFGSRTILYSGFGGTEYLNTLPANCPGLDDDDFIVTEIYGSQLCSGERIKPVDRFSGFSGPICRLGEFIPYTKPKK